MNEKVADCLQKRKKGLLYAYRRLLRQHADDKGNNQASHRLK